jgi:two-component system sensor histidine kinase DevS
MRALHRATLSLYTDLSPEGVLTRVVQAAKDLASARYAALGIPDGEGGLETFITLGMEEQTERAIPHRPLGMGLIGEMFRIGRSIRIPEIAEHPASIGFPPGHPIMHSFLGVPITAYGRSLGQIYLTDKIGAPAFDEEDQRLIEMLAAHAAAAIENARLHNQVLTSRKELAQRNEELALINTMATAVGSTMDLDTLLDTMLKRVIELFEAGVGEIHIRDEHEAGFSRAVHRGGQVPSLWKVDRFRPGQGLPGTVAKSGSPVWTNRLGPEAEQLSEDVVAAGLGTLVGVPLAGRGHVVGVLTLAFAGERSISESELGLLNAVGTGVGIAVENARLYRQARRLAVLEERERIGMDLHDGIIQSIFAVGLILDYARGLADESPAAVTERLSEAMDGLNAVIRDIRAYILDLQPARFDRTDLDEGLRLLLREFKANTLAETELRVDIEALNHLNRESSATLLHIAQEALGNAGKHARPARVEVALEHRNGQVVLTVQDNGRGFAIDQKQTTLGHGLSNMAERARQAGGEFEIASTPGSGTVVTARLPAPVLRKAARKGNSGRGKRAPAL